jgi:hypothetical protein
VEEDSRSADLVDDHDEDGELRPPKGTKSTKSISPNDTNRSAYISNITRVGSGAANNNNSIVEGDPDFPGKNDDSARIARMPSISRRSDNGDGRRLGSFDNANCVRGDVQAADLLEEDGQTDMMKVRSASSPGQRGDGGSKNGASFSMQKQNGGVDEKVAAAAERLKIWV